MDNIWLDGLGDFRRLLLNFQILVPTFMLPVGNVRNLLDEENPLALGLAYLLLLARLSNLPAS